MIGSYVARPPEYRAVQWGPDVLDDAVALAGDAWGERVRLDGDSLMVGEIPCRPGDWLVRTPRGEFAAYEDPMFVQTFVAAG